MPARDDNRYITAATTTNTTTTTVTVTMTTSWKCQGGAGRCLLCVIQLSDKREGGSYISWGWVPKCDDFMKITSDNRKMLPKCDDVMKMTPANVKETAKCSQNATIYENEVRGHQSDAQKHQKVAKMRRQSEHVLSCCHMLPAGNAFSGQKATLATKFPPCSDI